MFILLGAGIFYSPRYYSPRFRRLYPARIWRDRSTGAIFVLVGLVLALIRDELILDLQTRTFTRKRGLWPNLQTSTGSMDQIEALTLELQTRSARSGRTYNVWVVRLRFKEAKPGRILGSYRNESKAYSQFESLARTLEVPALDRRTEGQKAIPPGWQSSAVPASRPPPNARGLRPSTTPVLVPQGRVVVPGEPPH